MYRVIFLFEIDDVYHLLEEAVERLRHRKADLPPTKVLVDSWFRQQLRKVMHLALLDQSFEKYEAVFDIPFQRETLQWSDRLYKQLSLAIFTNAHPCLESWCQVKLTRFNLMLTFDVGPIDYGARLA